MVGGLWRGQSHCRPRLVVRLSLYGMWCQGHKSVMLFGIDMTDLVISCTYFFWSSYRIPVPQFLYLHLSVCSIPGITFLMASVCQSLHQIEALPSQCWHVGNMGQLILIEEIKWTFISFADEIQLQNQLFNTFNTNGRWHSKAMLPSVSPCI